jgi:glycosyltransferase involved in cell wall biosynthesis
LVHQLTYVGYRFPGYLWRLELPFVWGPLGGLENTPWSLLQAMDTGGMIYYAGRNVVNSMHRRFLRLPRRAIEAAGPGLIAATGGIRFELKRWYGADSNLICEVTAPDELSSEPTIRRVGEPIILAWSGAHLPGKALPLLLEALRGLPDGVDWTLDVFGSGPKTRRWKARAEELGLDPRCRWRGQVPREEALAGLADAHVFIITSLKDLTSTVLLEALSRGLPVLCPNHCGFPDVVTPECGILLPIDKPESFVRSLADAIEVLYRDEARRRSLAAGALRRARDFSVDAKAEAIDRVYAQVIAGHGRGKG